MVTSRIGIKTLGQASGLRVSNSFTYIPIAPNRVAASSQDFLGSKFEL